MPHKITSSANARVKNLLKLRRRTKPSGLIIVDGAREVARAVKAGCTVHEIYVCPELYSKEKPAFDQRYDKLTFELTPAIFEKVTFGERRDGVLLVCEPKGVSMDDLKVKDSALYLVLENVEKPGNLGAILRTCDSAGVDAVFVCDQQTYIYNPNVVRASLGAVFTVPVICEKAETIEKFLTLNGVKVYVAAPNVSTPYTKIDFRGKTAVLVGAENCGVSDFWMKKNHIKINIPMLGEVDSLNVSCSSAIILYEAIRQRQ